MQRFRNLGLTEMGAVPSSLKKNKLSAYPGQIA
jgi:hypothetical protein